MCVLLQIFSDMFREQNVPGIATIHHALGHIDAGTSHVRAPVYVHDAADRTAVHAHAQAKLGMSF